MFEILAWCADVEIGSTCPVCEAVSDPING